MSRAAVVVWGDSKHPLLAPVERDLLIAVLLLVPDFACRRQRHRAGQQQAGYTYSPIDAASTSGYITEA